MKGFFWFFSQQIVLPCIKVAPQVMSNDSYQWPESEIKSQLFYALVDELSFNAFSHIS